MQSCQRVLMCFTLLLLSSILLCTTQAATSDKPSAEEPKFLVIKEDVIPDVENTTQKVIRVNPLDLPPIKDDESGSTDSSLYKIQSLMPTQRKYVNSKRMRKPRPLEAKPIDSPIFRNLGEAKFRKPKQQLKKQKHLHFLYNQKGLAPDVQPLDKRMRVRIAPGAYPVYYMVSSANGKFGKFPIKGFSSPKEFMKYVIKNKLDPIQLAERYEQLEK